MFRKNAFREHGFGIIFAAGKVKNVYNMDIQSLKQRLSVRNVWQSLQRVVLRFPVAVGFLVCLTGLLSYLAIRPTDSNRVMGCIMIFLCWGIVISMVTSLWGEEQRDKRRKWIVEGTLLALCAVYCVLAILTDIIPGRGLPAFTIGNMAWLVAIMILIPFGSFWREKEDLKAWHFIFSLCAALLISGVISWVMIGGLAGLVLGTEALFDLQQHEKLYMVIMIVCSVLLFGMLFLTLIPHGERKHNGAAEMPSFMIKVVSWLLLPLLCCYIVVLYVYGINILVHWELPKGMISWLVSAVMGGYILCYLLLYPQVTNRQTWQSKALTIWLPIAILPLLVLMSVGVARRFMDYGLTAPRLYLLTLLLWYYAVCITMLVMPRKRFHWIFFSLAALFLLSSGHPFNYYRLCRPVLEAKIDKLMAEKETMTSEEIEDLYMEISHLRQDYGKEFVSRWELPDREEREVYTSREELWKVRYYNSKDQYLCPQGYARYERINRSFTYPMDALSDGMVSSKYDSTIVLLFDCGVIRQAYADQQPILLYSEDKGAAFAPTSITISAFSDETIDIYYSGYLFR